MLTAQAIIELLHLVPHPEEGGFFAETWRSPESLAAGQLPTRYHGPRAFGTAIHYLLTPGTFSAMHRLQSDEIFHLYLGGPVDMLHLSPDGAGREVRLGTDLAAGMRPQVVVERGTWQGARLAPGAEFALMGCTVAPGFEYADYEHGDRAELVRAWPDWAGEIARLTTEKRP